MDTHLPRWIRALQLSMPTSEAAELTVMIQNTYDESQRGRELTNELGNAFVKMVVRGSCTSRDAEHFQSLGFPILAWLAADYGTRVPNIVESVRAGLISDRDVRLAFAAHLTRDEAKP